MQHKQFGMVTRWVWSLLILLALASCGNVPNNAGTAATAAATAGGGTTTTTNTGTSGTTTGQASVPSSIGIRASRYSIPSDGSTGATLTVTVQDANNAAISGALVDFSTTQGLLLSSQVPTDAYGSASVQLTSGSSRLNAIATVTATVSGTAVSTQMPIQITGTTLSISGVNSSLDTKGVVSDTLTITLKDGGGQPIYGQNLSISSNGGLRFNKTVTDPYAVTTDVSGTASVTVDAKGVKAPKNPTQLSVSLNANTSVTRSYKVSGAAFGITAPATDPYAMTVADTYTITVAHVSPTNATVRFSTSLGGFGGVSTVKVQAKAGVASAVFQSISSGIANIQISVVGDPAQTTSTRFSVSQTLANATQVTLQSSANVVAKSSGNVQNSVQLTATVRDANGQPVGQAPVIFTMKNPVGGGESLSPVLAQTDASGVVTSTFTSGSLSSGAQGVDLYATLVKTTGMPAVDPYGIANVVIGGTAGSVAIGRGTVVTELDPSTYQLPMSLVVADSNGNPVSGAQVTLNAWPSQYRFGYWGSLSGTACQAVVIGTTSITSPNSTPNEDINKNLTLDAGENKAHTMAPYIVSSKTGYVVPSTDPYAVTVNLVPNTVDDGVLTPGNSTGGNLPASVVTDVNGVATFNLTYLKADALWVTTAITATTQVLGTEARGTIEFVLPYLNTDVQSCFLPASPFNNPAWGF